jgi:hypothetical protein
MQDHVFRDLNAAVKNLGGLYFIIFFMGDCLGGELLMLFSVAITAH